MSIETPPTTTPNVGPPDLFLILAIWGAIVDSRYKRRGGKRPTKREKLFFLSCIAVVVVLLFVVAALGASAYSIGYDTRMLAILLFALWEMKRWQVRHATPLSKTTVNPTAGVSNVGLLCPDC